MSCNGCRVLRKGCSDACVLRPSIEWIDGAQPQANATVFVAKFFGRAGLVASLAAVPQHHRQALFRSLLYEACGRTINPVSGAIGLMWTSNWDLFFFYGKWQLPILRNWDLCQAAAEAVLRGESLRALSAVPATFTDRDMDGLYGDVGTNTGSSSSLHSSPENSSSAPSRKRSKNNFCGGGQQMMTKLAPPVLQSRELDLCLTPVSPLGGGERRCGGGGASDEYSTTTCCEQQEASGDVAEAGAPALLNLFN